MVFASPIFLFLFLPVTLAGYFLAPKGARNAFLLVMSLLFYAWGEPRYLPLIVLSGLINYAGGLCIHLSRKEPSSPLAERKIVALAVTADLLILAYYKYANFMVDTLNALLSYVHSSPMAHEPIPLPIGISFFTFQAMSYVIDVYRHDAPAQRNPLNCLLYIALFPQLIAGPIVRYRQVAEQIVSRTVTTSGFAAGIQRLIYGLSKKVLLANPLGQVADAMFSVPAETLTTGAAWLGLVCYTLQIYYDFSGYSDMAIGLGRLFGFEFPENFAYPYTSRSIREFWRRWHMTLSFWFRDYLYIPLGGSRVSTARTYANLWLVFFLCGLWHGAGWTFVLWGALHGLYLVGERAFWGAALERLWRPVQHFYTLGLVMIGWVFFRAETLSSAVHYLSRLVGLAQTQAAMHDAWLHLDPKTAITLGIGCLLAAPVAPRWASTWVNWARNAGTAFSSVVVSTAHGALLAFLFVASAAHLAAGTYNPFIYFRF